MPELKRASTRAHASGGASSRRATVSRTPKCDRSAALAPNQRRSRNQAPSVSASIERSSVPGSATRLVLLLEQEPEEAARGEREQVGQLADGREARAPEHLLGVAADELAEVELHRLRRARDVVHAQRDVVLVAAHV